MIGVHFVSANTGRLFRERFRTAHDWLDDIGQESH